MSDDPYFGTHHFSHNLLMTAERTETFRKKLYEIPIVPFTTQEHILIRELMMDFSVNARLLIREVERLPKRESKKFWFDRYIDRLR